MHHSYGIQVHHFDLFVFFDSDVWCLWGCSCIKHWYQVLKLCLLVPKTGTNSLNLSRLSPSWTLFCGIVFGLTWDRSGMSPRSIPTCCNRRGGRFIYLLANVVTNRSFTNQQLVWLHRLPLQLWGTRRFLSFLWGISCRYQVPLCTGLSSCQNIFLSSTKCKVIVIFFTSLFWIFF